jgi:hypothetical protein
MISGIQNIISLYNIANDESRKEEPEELSPKVEYLLNFANFLSLTTSAYVMKRIYSGKFTDVRPCLILPFLFACASQTIHFTAKKATQVFPRLKVIILTIHRIVFSTFVGTTLYSLNKYVWRPGSQEKLLLFIVQPILVTVADELMNYTALATKKIIGERPLYNQPLNPSYLEKFRHHIWKVIILGKGALQPIYQIPKKVDQLFSSYFSIRTAERIENGNIKREDCLILEFTRNEFFNAIPHFFKETAACLAGTYVAARLGFSLFSFRAVVMGQLLRTAFNLYVSTVLKVNEDLEREDKEEQKLQNRIFHPLQDNRLEENENLSEEAKKKIVEDRLLDQIQGLRARFEQKRLQQLQPSQ